MSVQTLETCTELHTRKHRPTNVQNRELSAHTMEEEISIEELKANLVNYREQLLHVEGLLAAEPGNAEFEEVQRGLLEVIELTEDLLSSDQRDNTNHGLHSGADAHEDGFEDYSDQFAVGTKVQAVWSGDGEWYNATVEALTPLGYQVLYEGWGNTEEVDFDNVRRKDLGEEEGNSLHDVEKAAEATRLALKRKVAESADADIVPKNLPVKLQIKPDDPEDVKAAKRKKIHSFKSRMRLEKMEFAQNKRQNAWQQFQTSKSKSRKVGFFTGGKRESIFKSPEDVKGKVGVTGSGKGITEFQKREKHLNLKAGFDDGGD